MEHKQEDDGVGVAFLGAALTFGSFATALEESFRRMDEPTRQKLFAIFNLSNKNKKE